MNNGIGIVAEIRYCTTRGAMEASKKCHEFFQIVLGREISLPPLPLRTEIPGYAPVYNQY
jgi:hypothetical protein